ncbi:unnamed protein product [Agarophyton chilense]
MQNYTPGSDKRVSATSTSSSHEKPFICHHPDCVRPFNRKTSLTNHLKAHKNKKSRSIKRYRRAREKQLQQNLAAASQGIPHAAASFETSTNHAGPTTVPGTLDGGCFPRDEKPPWTNFPVPGRVEPIVTEPLAPTPILPVGFGASLEDSESIAYSSNSMPLTDATLGVDNTAGDQMWEGDVLLGLLSSAIFPAPFESSACAVEGHSVPQFPAEEICRITNDVEGLNDRRERNESGRSQNVRERDAVVRNEPTSEDGNPFLQILPLQILETGHFENHEDL